MPKRSPGNGRSSSSTLAMATLAAAGLVLVVNVQTYLTTRNNQTALTERLTRIETQMGQLSNKMDSVSKGGGQRGPDPNKVYAIKMDGAPVKGNPKAPVTVVEFSDFQ